MLMYRVMAQNVVYTHCSFQGSKRIVRHLYLPLVTQRYRRRTLVDN